MNIKESAKMLNRAKKYNENRDTIEQLQQQLRRSASSISGPLSPFGVPTEPGVQQRYIGEGAVQIQSPMVKGSSNAPVSVYLFLFEDQLLITKKNQERILSPIRPLKSNNNAKFQLLCIIPIDEIVIEANDIKSHVKGKREKRKGSRQELRRTKDSFLYFFLLWLQSANADFFHFFSLYFLFLSF